jgi:hypothetical protein
VSEVNKETKDLPDAATHPQHAISAMVHLSPTRYPDVDLASWVSMMPYRRRVSV